MDSIIAQIRALAKTSDEAGHLAIQKALNDVQLELQGPNDLLYSLANSQLLIGTIRIGSDLKLFRTIATNSGSQTVSQLAETTQAHPLLLERLLRYLGSNKMIEEVGCNEYQANKNTHVLANERGEAMVYHGFDIYGPIIRAMPEFFKENGYQDIDSITNTPFHKAFNTTLPPFDWYVKNPKHFETLQKIMTSIEGVEWSVGFELFDLEAIKVPSTSPQASEKPFLVDVGGGHGHQCIQLSKKYPALSGRLVLQDLPAAIDKLPLIEGVKAEAHDFFQKQPVTGAKFYYLRRIMHDWPDKECTKILQNIVGAMDADSRILIDDVVLPDTGAHWQMTMADISMMIGLGGKERTVQQWNSLANSAGLRVEHIHPYTASTYTSIVVLVPN